MRRFVPRRIELRDVERFEVFIPDLFQLLAASGDGE